MSFVFCVYFDICKFKLLIFISTIHFQGINVYRFSFFFFKSKLNDIIVLYTDIFRIRIAVLILIHYVYSIMVSTSNTKFGGFVFVDGFKYSRISVFSFKVSILVSRYCAPQPVLSLGYNTKVEI